MQYIGLDYFTALTLYNSKPDIYGNAEQLPIKKSSIDAVLVLDVIEHVKDPESCIQEITRVLSEGGKLILNVPFMYPIHDAPHDFQRWTICGLRNSLEKNNLTIEKEDSLGNSFETSGLLLNLAMCKTGFTLFENRHPGCAIILLFPAFIPIINICAFVFGKLFKQDDFMPYRYHLTEVKKFSN